jgi:hypothetical protein
MDLSERADAVFRIRESVCSFSNKVCQAREAVAYVCVCSAMRSSLVLKKET